MYVYMYVCMDVGMYGCMYVWMYVCVDVCMYVWLFIREYINNMRPTGPTRGRINCGSTILITINKKY